jgi:crotonobetainyl-CoA:carnitine CoA-transferase CaiB-like acyl-CoA transferase
MYDLLNGVRVVEVSSWLFAPSSGAILADWGADVIKVEHPVTPDPYRGYFHLTDVNPAIELANRGKRGVGIDLTNPRGREILYQLVDNCDVFVTSILEAPRKRLGIELEDIRRRNPNVIYVRATGQGPLGPDANVGGYDLAACWARAGFSDFLTAPGAPSPVPQPGGIGDCVGGLSLAGGIAAALFRRERTGETTEIDVSLLHGGLWMMSVVLMKLANEGATGQKATRHDRLEVPNPLVNCFRTSDDRWLWLVLLQPDVHWPSLCQHLGRPELVDDPRFCDYAARMENRKECVCVLDEIFASRTLDEWRTVLRSFKGVWAPNQSPAEVLSDPQVIANGYISESNDGAGVKVISSPVQFGHQPLGDIVRAPVHGQHTEEVLLEQGLSWETISELKECGAIN